MPASSASPDAPLAEVGRLFFRLGCTAFGGPAAHIALMEDDVVQRRGWVSREQFADLVAASSLIPGPNSTELAMHLGYLRAGWPGLYLAGMAFLVPAVVLVWGLAWLYATTALRVDAQSVLAAMQPAVLAVVVQAIWRLRAAIIRTRWTAALAVGALAASLLGCSELVVLGLAALLGVGIGGWRMRRSNGAPVVLPPVPPAPALLGPVVLPVSGAASAAALTPWAVFLSFAKIGSLLFGSGYVLLPALRGEFVARLGILSDATVLDALAAGQVTPGPLFATATFVGYQLAGHAGAAAATAGIFLPAFAAVTLTAPVVMHLRRSRLFSPLLDAVQAAALALMAAVVLPVAASLAPSGSAIAILVGSSVLLLATPVGSGWVLLSAALFGWLRAL
jgi:chromate transporter